MIKHLHSIICNKPLIDQNTSLASYIEIPDGFTCKEAKKLTLPTFWIITKFWIRDGIENDQTLEVEISRRKPGKARKFDTQHMEFPIKEKGETILIQLEVTNMVVEEEGIWVFDVKWRIKDSGNWKKATTIPLKITSQKDTTATGKETEKK